MTIEEKVDRAFEALVKPIGYLYWRWQDEGMYEDFRDYKIEMCKRLEEVLPGSRITKATKRPFGFTFTFEGKTYKMGVNSKRATIARMA